MFDTLAQVRTREAISVRELQPSVPKDLETICQKCLQKDPAKRYASADELATDLSRFLDGRAILARPVSTAEKGWRWCKRNRLVAGLTAAVAAVLVAGAAVSTTFGVQAGWSAQSADANATAALTAKGDADASARLASANERTAVAAADRARWSAYLAGINRAGDALRSGNVSQVRAALDETRPHPDEPDPRGWEWHCLDNLLNAGGTRYRYQHARGDPSEIVTLSQDGAVAAIKIVDPPATPDAPPTQCWRRCRQ